MSTIELTPEQRIIANKAIHNVMEGKKQSFITGPAGCGKTTIANEIANILFEKYDMNVYFAAPTHTASNRLQKCLSEGDRQIQVSTVHKFLGMKPIKNEYGKITFAMSIAQKIGDKSILILDESSMLNDECYRNITKVCEHRVIFLGDSCQIPPIPEDAGGDRNRLMTENDSEPPVKRNVMEVFELNTVHRQKNDTALYNLCKYLRDSILDGSCIKLYNNKAKLIEIIREFAAWNDDTVFIDIPGEDVVPSILEIPDTCFLAYGVPTVEAVQLYLPKWYVDGGYGILNTPVFKAQENDHEGKTGYSMIFPNNAHVKINRIIKGNYKKWGITFDSVAISDKNMSCDVLAPSEPEKFQDEYQGLINIAKHNDGLSVKLTPKQQADYKKFNYGLIDKKTLTDFISTVTTLREGRASTVHRAQGQQWDNCIIAFNNIMFAGMNMGENSNHRFNDTHRKIIAMKLLYTAISRAKEKVVFCFETEKGNYKPKVDYAKKT